jgi:hypothetical protein
MAEDRPPIPLPVKRLVRQQCAFGCVLCGLPLYEYDHIVPYDEAQEHQPDNLALLCPTHHAEKTRGLLSADAVRQARQAPANSRSCESSPFLLRYSGQQCRANLGSNIHVWPVLAEGMFTVPLLIDDTPVVLFRVEDGQLLLTVQLIDSTNRLLVQIIDSELVYSILPWDVEFEAQTLTVRSGPGDIFVRIRFEPPDGVSINRAHIFRNGIEVDVTPDRIMVLPNQNSIAGSTVVNAVGGLCLGDHPPLGGFMSMGVNRIAFTTDAATEARVLRIGQRQP